MKKLPTEIVIEITSRLSISDKPNLACVCKGLYKSISENSLYNKLVFKHELKFNQAMKLYDRRNFGQQVRDIYIGNVRYDAQLVTAPPTLFLRVRHLQIKRGRDESDSQIDETYLQNIKGEAKNWKMY